MVSGLELAATISLAVVLVISIAANGLALIVFCSRSALRTVSNRFVMNLLGGNVACAAILGPLLLVELSGGSSAIGGFACAAAEGSAAAFSLAAVLAVLLVAADQYLAVTDPLRYRSRVGRARSILALIAIWAAAVVAALSAALAPKPTRSAWKFCRNGGAVDFGADLYKTIYSTAYLIVVAVSLVAICVMYARISMAARRSARPPAPPPALFSLDIETPLPLPLPRDPEITCESDRLLKGKPSGPPICVAPRNAPYEPRLARSLRSVLLDGDGPFPPLRPGLIGERRGLSHDDVCTIAEIPPLNGLKTVRSSPDFGAGDCKVVTPRPASYASTLRCRISNASLFRYREESRAARVSASVAVLALAGQLPAAAIQAAPSLGVAPLVALCVCGAISPFLFAYRSRRVKGELRRMFTRRDSGPSTAPLRRASSLSTERSWRGSESSSAAALRLLRALAEQREGAGKRIPAPLSCAPGKSILKRVRARSRKWSKRSKRCEFSQVSVSPPRDFITPLSSSIAAPAFVS